MRGLGAEEGGQGRGVFDRGGEADAAQLGVHGLQAGELQHELVAAFGFCKCMNFINNYPLQACKDAGGVFVAEQEGEAFWCGQQDMRRVGALAAALGVGGVAGAVLDTDRQGSALDRPAQVAADIGGQRLERRDVEGVQALGFRGDFGEGGQKACQRLAAAGGGDQQGGGLIGAGEHVKLVRVQRPALGFEPLGEGGGELHGGEARGAEAVRKGCGCAKRRALG